MTVSTSLDQLSTRAELLARADHWGAEAGDINAEILILDPTNIGALTRLAKWCLKQERNVEAEKLYRRVLQLSPANSVARNGLDSLLQQRRYQKIADECTTFEQAFKRGVEERHRGKSELAAVILEKAERLCHTTAGKIALAAAYRDIHRLSSAEAIYRDVLRHGSHKAALVGLAGVLRDLDRLPEAMSLCIQALELEPDDVAALTTLAAVKADMRRAGYDIR